jgi:predicted RNA-binding protein (virulence factor B family)
MGMCITPHCNRSAMVRCKYCREHRHFDVSDRPAQQDVLEALLEKVRAYIHKRGDGPLTTKDEVAYALYDILSE